MRAFLLILVGIFYYLPNTFGQCNFENLQVTYTDCDDVGNFYAELSFQYDDTSSMFIVIGDNIEYDSFVYSDLPLKIGPLSGNCRTDYFFKVFDVSNGNCYSTVVGGVQCCSSDCNVKITDVSSSACEDKQYSLTFGLENPEQLGKLVVYNNGEIVGYIYEPEAQNELNNLESSKTNKKNILKVCLFDDPNCCDIIEFLSPCGCDISNIRTQIVQCNEEDSTFSVRINFEYASVSDSFKLGGDGNNYGHFAYNDLPVTITGLKFDDTYEYEFLIIDLEQTLCFNYVELGPIVDCNHPCSIASVSSTFTQCDEHGKLYANISFEDENTSVDGFTINGNGQIYGAFQYGHDTYKIGPIQADCKTIYEFEIKDKSIDGCHASIQLDSTLCCDQPCSLYDLVVKENCDDGVLNYITIDFKNKNTSSKKYNIKINGQVLGTFSYSDLPLKIFKEDIKDNTLQIYIWDDENGACVIDAKHIIQCNQSPCNIEHLEVKALPCDEEGYFQFKITYNVQTNRSSAIILKINGQIHDTLAFDTTNYISRPFKGDCKTLYSILVYDIQNPSKCSATYDIKKPICCDDNESPCELDDPRIKFGNCIDNIYSIELNFIHSGNSKQFTVKINQDRLDTYNYEDLPITLTDLDSDNRVDILIRDTENEKCLLDISITAIDCITSASDISVNDIKITHDNHTLMLLNTSENEIDILGILDIQGRMMSIGRDNQIDDTIDIGYLVPGIYLLRLQLGDVVLHKRFVKF